MDVSTDQVPRLEFPAFAPKMSAMAAHAATAPGGPSLTIRGRPYPVLLPKVRDPRLHLAAVITSLQILGQVAFHFSVSISQILISLVTAAVLEVGIAAWRQHVLLWPASALITGNSVAFILRVPGTHHGDWWSMNGWWIYAGTAAVSLLSKHVIQVGGRHIFNPSNFGLVLCFLLLGPGRAEPLDFWWGPMSPWLGLAFAIIVGGASLILGRLKLLGLAAALLVHLRRRGRRARGDGTHDGGALAPRSDHRRVPLVGSADVAGDPRLPLLHDHRPAHDSARAEGARRIRHRASACWRRC